MVSLIGWLILSLFISIIWRPILSGRTLDFPDGGFVFSLTLGSLFSFLPAWYLSAFGLCDFDFPVCFISTVLLGALLNLIHIKNNNYHMDKTALREFLSGFAAFSVLFVLFMILKSCMPSIDSSTEQYMDYGYMQAIYRQKAVPPEDIWNAGNSFNYYYLGLAYSVFMCRMSFTTPEYGYNLMQCYLFAALVMSVFSLSYAVISKYSKKNIKASVTGGIISSAMVTLSGNGHWLIYGPIAFVVGRLTGRDFNYNAYGKYWYPDATVYIGYWPDVPDKCKTEFPAYTLILGDLHAHLINSIFVVAVLMILFDYAFSQISAKAPDESGRHKIIIKEIINKNTFMLAIMLGYFQGANYWDFPIYFVVSGAVILFADLKRKGLNACTVLTVLLKGAFILIMSFIVSLPFTLRFESIVTSICFADAHTPIYKFLVLWAVSLIMCVFLTIYILNKRKRLLCIEAPEWGIIAVLLCAVGLLILPEIIYVKDIYGEAYARFNTVFKLTYQAFIIFGILYGIYVGLELDAKKHIRAGLFILICILSGTYFFYAVDQKYGIFSSGAQAESISVLYSYSQYEPNSPEEAVYKATEYINGLEEKRVCILECAGADYTASDMLSSFTGAVTVMGWFTHEWLWTEKYEECQLRQSEVTGFYTSGDRAYCESILEKYGIEYVFVGPAECDLYGINRDGFAELVYPVWTNESGIYGLYRVIGK